MKKYNKIILGVVCVLLLIIPFVYMAVFRKKKAEVPQTGSDQTRGKRNNNPLNLRKTGTDWKHEVAGNDAAFESFDSMMWGVRAGLRNMRTHFNRGNTTIEKLISLWAPPSENDTESYIQFVEKQSGLKRDEELKWEKDVFYPIIKAMCQIESLYKLERSMYDEAWERID